jgi:hypothetical protein
MNRTYQNYLETKFGTGHGNTIGVSQLPNSIRDRRKVIANAYHQSKPHTVTKPGRQLSGAWMDKYIANRVSVNLCEVCKRIYGPWLMRPKYDYRPQTSQAKLGDCDGCGGTGHPERLISYYPSEYYQERKLKPNPKLIIKGVM